ncbi:hypothetical protein GGX14DRAFT_653369 [Mycena pura]|uniref:Uncharacterized protein n=1 Tax=Mycena pura TaxID=153505 RepID=A0AAD6YAU2_9AGAR|nr:hypothetical protein GGX14DRAFT_653369 [Mycena pura]
MSLPPPPPPPPQSSLSDSSQLFHISSLAAALDKLNIGIPVDDVIQAVRREDKAKRAALSECNSTQSTGLEITPEERRRRLVQLAKDAFPDGKILLPTSAVLSQFVCISRLDYVTDFLATTLKASCPTRPLRRGSYDPTSSVIGWVSISDP